MDEQNNDICTELLAVHAPEQELKVRKSISTSEKGVRYTATVNPERETVVFQVDGCIICDGDKCDKLVLSKNPTDTKTWIGHFVELKHSDVEHAIDQLEATIRHTVFKHPSLTRKYARIVATRFPANNGNTPFERARERFADKYRCNLKRLKPNQPDSI